MKIVLKIVAPILILMIAVLTFKKQKDSAPQRKGSDPKPVESEAMFVSCTPSDYSPPVRSFGTVSSYFETNLNAQVSGRIVGVDGDFRVGRIVREGAHLVEIESIDFEAALENQKAALSLAKRALAEEEIRGQQAVEDWKISGRALKSAPEYALRKPQLAAALADVQAARSAVEKAEADLDRTMIVAPFDALVTARSASVGNLATPQSVLGTLVATERAEVFLPLTPDQVRRVELPVKGEAGPAFKLTSALYPDAVWEGEITRISPTISRDQVVTVIAEVQKPFESDPPLSIGSFVNAEIVAKPLGGVYRVPEAALVNDADLWAIDSEEMLVRLDAIRLHSDLGFAFVKLDPGELEMPLRIVTRPLTNFHANAKVRPVAVPQK